MPMTRSGSFLALAAVTLAGVSYAVYAGLHARSNDVHAADQAFVPNSSMKLTPDSPTYQSNVAVNGFLPISDFTGTPIQNIKCAQGVVQSSTAGAWSVDYTGLGFTTAITRMDVSTASPGTTISALSGMYSASFTAPTLTGVSGRVMQPATVVIGGMAVAFATTPVSVYVTVCGS